MQQPSHFQGERNVGGSVGHGNRDRYESTYLRYGDQVSLYEFACGYSAGLSVLDYGCGGGFGCSLIATKGRAQKVIGVDVDAGAIQLAKQRYVSLTNLSFETFDGYSIPFNDQSFDMIVSFEVIEHVSDVSHYLAEIKRLLKPDGLALFSTPNRNLTRMGYWWGKNPSIHHLHEYSPAEFRRLLEVWFSRVELRKLYRNDYGDVKVYLWLRSFPGSALRRFLFWTMMQLRWREELRAFRSITEQVWWTMVQALPASKDLVNRWNSWEIQALSDSEMESYVFSHMIASVGKG
jgi:SAM-dependent methyltransferase